MIGGTQAAAFFSGSSHLFCIHWTAQSTDSESLSCYTSDALRALPSPLPARTAPPTPRVSPLQRCLSLHLRPTLAMHLLTLCPAVC